MHCTDVSGGAGLSGLPDPHKLIAHMVDTKLSNVRATLASGYAVGEKRFPPADLSLLRGRVQEVLRRLPQQQVRGGRVVRAWCVAVLGGRLARYSCPCCCSCCI